jgi:hypothetical protein
VHAWPSRLQLALATAAKLVGHAGWALCADVPPSSSERLAGLHAGTRAPARTADAAAARKLARVDPTSIS